MVLGCRMECNGAGEVFDAHPKDLVLNLLMLQDISSLKPNVLVDPVCTTCFYGRCHTSWLYMLYFQFLKYVSFSNKKNHLYFIYRLFQH